MAFLRKDKAKEILRHGEVHGKPLTGKQKGLFGLIAGGGRPNRIKRAGQIKAIKKTMKK